MKAARIHEFGSPDVITIDDVPPPTPNEGEILVRVAAAGVGPWDALFRERKITVRSPLPLILGSDLSGVVEATGPGVTKFRAGNEVYGVDIQFIHVRSRHPNALPVIMTHGWPGSILELLKTVEPLTDPTAHGGRGEDAFDLVIPPFSVW